VRNECAITGQQQIKTKAVMKRSQNDSGNVSRNEQMQQRAHQSRLRYDVNARLNANIIATLPLARREFQRQETECSRPNASDQMQVTK
jgi:hypothetical protein